MQYFGYILRPAERLLRIDGIQLSDKEQLEIMAGIRAASEGLGAVLAGQKRMIAAIERQSGLLGAAAVDKVRPALAPHRCSCPSAGPLRRD